MSWFERLALRLMSSRTRSLKGLRRAKPIKVEGRIVTDDHVPSLVTSARAAVLTSALLEQRPGSVVVHGYDHLATPGGAWNVPQPGYEILAVIQAHGPLVVGTEHGRVLVPQGDLDIRYVTPLDRHPRRLNKAPEGFEEAWTQSDRPKFYSERYLRKGDAITLMATVRPRRRDTGAYRSAPLPDTEFEVDFDAEAPILFEEEFQSGGSGEGAAGSGDG